jgi:septum formation protein
MILSSELLLGSGSPRRKEILEHAGFRFSVEVKPTDEDFPIEMSPEEVPVYLSRKKADAFDSSYNHQIVICADTVVILDEKILNKPKNETEAKQMLESLSGRKHSVVTGVVMKSSGFRVEFADRCEVFFDALSKSEIDYYIETCKPFDKAGSYGIQDFIGMARIKRLEGSFYTVMGLPIHLVYEHLKPFISFKQT